VTVKEEEKQINTGTMPKQSKHQYNSYESH